MRRKPQCRHTHTPTLCMQLRAESPSTDDEEDNDQRATTTEPNGAQLGAIPLIFYHHLWQQKTTVAALSCGVIE